MALRHTLLSSLVALPLMSAAAVAEEVRYEIDPSHFSLVFAADHIGYGNTWGMFLKGSGSFMFDEDAKTLSDLTVEIDTGSVFSNHEKRDEHLRNADFLHVEEFPVATFVMTEATPTSDTTGTITGDLTLIGQTHPVTLDVTLNKVGPYPWGDNYAVGITATTTIKRSEWGMNYAVENGLVGDEIPLTIELEAIREKSAS
ncbi:MAG: YceI family protein [Pseudomonadota bacterium]